MDVNTAEKNPLDIVKIKITLEIKSPTLCEERSYAGTVDAVCRYCCLCFFDVKISASLYILLQRKLNS